MQRNTIEMIGQEALLLFSIQGYNGVSTKGS